MALITTYDGLSAAVAEWMGRAGDTDITSRFDDLLALHEQRMYYGAKEVPGLIPAFEPLRIREMETSDSAFALDATVAQPTGFLELISATMTSDSRPLDIVAEGVIDGYGSTSIGGTGLIAISGTNFRVKDDPDGATCTLRYFRKLGTPAPSSANWILENAPGVYLQGCLLQGAILTGDLESAKAYASMYIAEVGGLNERRRGELQNATNVRMRLRGRTP